jgi:hypothetical protein
MRPMRRLLDPNGGGGTAGIINMDYKILFMTPSKVNLKVNKNKNSPKTGNNNSTASSYNSERRNRL